MGERPARELVRAFFHALSTEDLASLASLLTSDATFGTLSGGPKASALDVFRARIQRFDYLPLARAFVYEEARVEAYRYEEFDAKNKLSLARPAGMVPGELVLRIPIATTHTQAGRVLGDEVVLLIRREGERPRIRAIVEEFLGW